MNNCMPTNWITNSEEMNKFLETYNRQTLNHEERERLTQPIMSWEIESATKKLSTK